MTHQVNDSKLKEKDEKSILKLASKIEGKKSSIAEELEKISEKEKQRILTTEVSKHRGKEPTIISLAYAILRKDSIAVEKMLRVAKENGILKDILNTTITIKHKNNQKVTDKLLAALHDRKVIQKILDIARENDILKDILNATITIKYPDSEEKIYTPLTYTISCKSNEAFNTTRAINQDGQEKTHIPFPTLDKRETELKLKEKRQSRRDEGLNFNNGSSDKNVEIKVNGDILLQHSSGIENEINHTAVRNDVRGVKPLIESRVNVKVQNINAVIATSVTFKMIATSVTLELVASKITCVLSKPTTKLEEVAITYFQGLALYL
ncbi:WD_0033/WD_0034 family tandem repeat-containing protein [Wolbachia sp. wLmal]|uniref:WD_0033/WD_0034 family tandem repeat-containing protein n=1 Tax=Wolbachia sp. wLmal TaxID=3342489 RepID=UPI003C2EF72F